MTRLRKRLERGHAFYLALRIHRVPILTALRWAVDSEIRGNPDARLVA